MYKVASRKAQARLVRPIGEMLPSYMETLTPEQQRDCLKAVLHSVAEELKSEKDRWRLKELGQRKHELQEKMHAIRPKRKAPGVEQFFIEVCKEKMTKVEFNQVMDLAVKRMESK